MIRFECDYNNGCHERLMQALLRTNEEQAPGYGEDSHCAAAREYILALCGVEQAQVHFLVGGTQTNTTVIASILRPWQGVLSAATGHVALHETGAIEATGHKVLTLPTPNGKLSAALVQQAWEDHCTDVDHEHMVQPGMVYISHPTETGVLYSRQELAELSQTCRRLGLPLFLDGARLSYALAAQEGELGLRDIARLCDVFYLGGTKCGALFGEAVVITDPALQKDFRYCIKQRGGMLAKGRLLGIQFEELFRDGLYLELGRHAIRMAREIKATLVRLGCDFLYDSDTNQQFPILSKAAQAKLGERYSFAWWKRIDAGHDAVRICTSWSTKEADVQALIADLEQVLG